MGKLVVLQGVCVCVLHGWLRLLHGESPRDAGVSRERKSIQIQINTDSAQVR